MLQVIKYNAKYPVIDRDKKKEKISSVLNHYSDRVNQQRSVFDLQVYGPRNSRVQQIIELIKFAKEIGYKAWYSIAIMTVTKWVSRGGG